KPNDSQDLSKKLKELWQDEQKAKEYGANAKARFDDIFSLDNMVVSYKSVYDEVIYSGVKLSNFLIISLVFYIIHIK
ncbi:hypothetical protein NAI78_12940, partial [Francisella tularensis subsp. holarctica]|nr:hypothetical protein [Francisella tularensis subsp. holarctica]